ncbi:MAG: ribbon-helix-helix protein, CopG family [Armatimonadetes bacterium]|nr:ribbon-helix-helix protein, CopG family [Armatimonadota bacterium]
MKRPMKPYQLYLSEHQHKQLDELASRLNTSKAALVRDAIDNAIASFYRPEDDPAMELIGLAADLDLPVDLAADHDLYLAGDE